MRWDFDESAIWLLWRWVFCVRRRSLRLCIINCRFNLLRSLPSLFIAGCFIFQLDCDPAAANRYGRWSASISLSLSLMCDWTWIFPIAKWAFIYANVAMDETKIHYYSVSMRGMWKMMWKCSCLLKTAICVQAQQSQNSKSMKYILNEEVRAW